MRTAILIISIPLLCLAASRAKGQSQCLGVQGCDDEYTSLLQVSSPLAQVHRRTARASSLSAEEPEMTETASLLELGHQTQSGIAISATIGAMIMVLCLFLCCTLLVSFLIGDIRNCCNVPWTTMADDDQRKMGCSAGGSVCLCVLVALFIAFFTTSISPLEYGVLKSKLSGHISHNPVRGGLHFLMPWEEYVALPATRVTIMWAKPGFHRNDMPHVVHVDEVKTRTGRDPKDRESGGQPLSLACSLQIKLIPEKLRQIFLDFGDYATAEQRFILLAGNMVSNTAQDFTPQDFWEERNKVAKQILHEVNETLIPQGAIAVSFQLLRINFAESFEDSITNVQVAEQEKVVNEYDMQVQQVEQEINVKNSTNQADIRTIEAKANRKAKETIADATKTAFILKQNAKSKMLRKIQKAFEFSDEQLNEYIKIRSLMAQSSQGKEVISIAPPFSLIQAAAPSPTKLDSSEPAHSDPPNASSQAQQSEMEKVIEGP